MNKSTANETLQHEQQQNLASNIPLIQMIEQVQGRQMEKFRIKIEIYFAALITKLGELINPTRRLKGNHKQSKWVT